MTGLTPVMPPFHIKVDFFFFFFFVVLQFGLSLHLEPFHQPFFVMGFFKIGSRKLLGFELPTS
jgi:hypothetical protein